MAWNDDMTLAPSGEEWVLGAIQIDKDNPDAGYAYESIICDGGVWMDTRGNEVFPSAWRKIAQYRPQSTAYEWESDDCFYDFFVLARDMLPLPYAIQAIAVANVDTAEGALIFDESASCEHDDAIFIADICKDIAGDADAAYNAALRSMRIDFESRREK